MVVILVGFCIAITLLSGIGLVIYNVFNKNWSDTIIGFIVFILGGLTLFCFNEEYYPTTYIPAEPLAYNSTQTVFTTDKGTYTANGLYPDGTYMLTVDGDDVLVVWQAVDGAEG